MKFIRYLLLTCAGWVLLTAPVAAKIGDPVATFASSPLINQLALTAQAPVALSDPMAAQMLHRYVSDDNTLTVDIIAVGGRIVQELLYVPIDIQRSVQVGWFLQDATGSVVGATQGLIAYRAAVTNRRETFHIFGAHTMRFTPLNESWMRVMVTR